MKKALFILLSITLLFSCQDPVIGPGFSDEDPNNASQSSFQVDFDGQTFIASQIATTFVGEVINITGFRGNNGEAIILTINANSTGTYPLGISINGFLSGGTYLESNGSQTPFISVLPNSTEEQGQVVITEINTLSKKITGTFYFTGHSNTVDGNGTPIVISKEFTNGEFENLEYIDDLGTGNNTDNTFFAKIDSVEFVEDNFSGTVINFSGMSTIGISAVKNNLESIGFSLPSDITSGTYDLSSFGEYRGMYTIGTSEINGAKSGTITIVTHDLATKYIEATFEFVAGPPVGTTEYAITDGEFELTYQ